jgi:signal recognition particle receptor subunit beta
MAIYDVEKQRVVVRIVYDGPAHAGKTTNLQQLCGFFTTMRRSEMFTPGEKDGRTLYFDWLQLEGGLVGGFRLSCQLLTVPGQNVLTRRRVFLLNSADVIVFVLESTRQQISRARNALDRLTAFLKSQNKQDTPLVIQANKQDLPGAIPAEELVTLISRDTEWRVVGSRAKDGAGVKETAVLAIRAAADRVQRTIIHAGIDALQTHVQSASELYSSMLEEEKLSPLWTLSSLIAEVNVEAEIGQGAHAHKRDNMTAVTAVEREAGLLEKESVLATRKARDIAQALPHAEVPTGFIWPATTGRQILRELGKLEVKLEPNLGDRGKSETVVCRAGGWSLKTSSRRCFSDVDAGRQALLNLARAKLAIGSFLPPQTVLALHEETQSSYWLWTVCPWLPSLDTQMKNAARVKDVPSLAFGLSRFASAAVESMRLAAAKGVVLDVHPTNFSVVADSIVYLDDDIEKGSRIQSIGYAVLQRADEYTDYPKALEVYQSSLEEALLERISLRDAQRIDLPASIDHVVVRTDHARNLKSYLLEVISRCRE